MNDNEEWLEFEPGEAGMLQVITSSYETDLADQSNEEWLQP